MLSDPHGTKGGTYRNHPETKRWFGHERAFAFLMQDTRDAMLERTWKPKELPAGLATMTARRRPTKRPAPWDDQLATLRAKGCDCHVPSP